MITEEKATTQGLVKLALVALCAGAVTGVAGALFRLTLTWADKTRLEVLHYSHQYPYLGWLIPVIAAAVCVAIARFLVRLEPLASGSGVQHVEAVMRGEAQPAPRGVVPVKFVGGVLAIGAGMVLGREGPTVQMGSVIGSSFGKWLGLRDDDIPSLQAATAGAGLAVAFNAPLGGALFVFEEVAHSFRTRLALMTLLACGTSMAVAQLILGNPLEFLVKPPAVPGIWTLVPYVGMGLLLGALSVGYNRLIVKGLDLFNYYTRWPVEVRAALIGALIGAVGWIEPRLIGGGDSLNQQVLTGGLSLTTLAILFAIRWFLGPVSYSAGTPGGLFAPLLVVGALFGSLYAGILQAWLPGLGLDLTAFAIVGMAAFFVGVVRAPFTGIVLVVEMTATTTLLVPLLIASFGAMLAATLLRGEPIYDTLRTRMLRSES
ncbi:MAG: H(+)/Cl(-) exchange transporter ClcA [Caldilineaceae bacterium]